MLQMPDLILALAVVSTSLAMALAALMVISAAETRAWRARRMGAADPDDAVAFLFDDEMLLDASPRAQQLLSAAPKGEGDWRRLMTLLTPRFPELPERLQELAEQSRLSFLSTDGGTRLTAESRGGPVRLCVSGVETGRENRVEIDRQSLTAMQRELATLRATTDRAPYLVWRQDRDGAITWVNRAYLDLAARLAPEANLGTWPPPPLFDAAALHALAEARPASRRRLAVATDGGHGWFDCHGAAIEDDTLFFAIGVDATVRAEAQLRDFVQTLTKTFAHLKVGLAVFDSARHMALFNPALADLTRLPVAFLAGRPTLFGFLDRLREHRMIPEPKNYAEWRARLTEMESTAADGTFTETWSLDGGRTYRVSGRPHPEGGVAFTFEDISAEISLTRMFRADLELCRAVIDSLDEAVAVFDRDGTLQQVNAAYRRLWADAPMPSADAGTTGFAETVRAWRGLCAPTPAWDEMRAAAGRAPDRRQWSAEVQTLDGRGLRCRVTPLGGGATLVGFSAVAAAPRGAESRTGS